MVRSLVRFFCASVGRMKLELDTAFERFIYTGVVRAQRSVLGEGLEQRAFKSNALLH